MINRIWSGLALLGLLSVLSAPARLAQAQPRPTPGAQAEGTLRQIYADAAREFGVPEPVLLAVSYHLSRWEEHGAAPSTAGGYGLMHLASVDGAALGDLRGDSARPARMAGSAPGLHTLEEAAQLLGARPEELKRDRALNVRGGAALLARYGRETLGRTPATLGEWYGAVARYSGFPNASSAAEFADAVYATLQRGASRTTSTGERLAIAPQQVDLPREVAPGATDAPTFQADCPHDLPCQVVPAAYATNSDTDPSDYGNYDLANRPYDGLDIHYIVIHDTEISYDLTLRVFQNPAVYAATHYVVRSADGHVAQMVENRHVAWHAGNWYVNGRSIGIEHEGVAIEGASWYTEHMYRSSAKLVRYLGLKYGIPLDRAHIIGHDEIPGPTPASQPGMHWDPGPFWDWAHYMELVRGAIVDEPGSPDILEISPDFATNSQPLSYCYTANDCRPVATPPANFVYLRTAPDHAAPYVTNPYISADPTRASNWANKALTGQRFYRFARHGDWDGIYFGGLQAWLYNPAGAPVARPASGLLVTPKEGAASIPIYGRAYPEAAAYPDGVTPQALLPIYNLPAGQIYVASPEVQSAYYYSPVYTAVYSPTAQFPVIGQETYYQIWFNHRFGYVRSADVDVITSPRVLDLEVAPLAETLSGPYGETVTHTLHLTNTGEVTSTYTISQTGAQWTTTALPPSIELAPGESVTLTLVVAVPDSPAGLPFDRVAIWLRKVGDQEGRVALATLTTRTYRLRVLLPLLLR